jgi:hypothetical protein
MYITKKNKLFRFAFCGGWVLLSMLIKVSVTLCLGISPPTEPLMSITG